MRDSLGRLAEDVSQHSRAHWKRAIADELRFLWRQRRPLLVIVSSTVILAVAVALVWPPTYEASAQLLPSDPPTVGINKLGALAGIASFAAGSDPIGLRSPAGKFLVVLRSRTVEDRIIERFDLTHIYGAKLKVNARKGLEQRTILTEDRKSGVITIKVRDRDRYRAAQIVGAYIEELNHVSAELNSGAAQKERIFLESRLQQVREQMDRAAQQLATFSSKTGVIEIAQQAKTTTEAVAQLQGQIAGLESTLSGLRTAYTDNSLRVRELQARIAELNRKLEEVRGTEKASSGVNLQMPSLTTLPNLGVTYSDLLRDTKVLNSVFEVLSQQLELAKIEEAKELPTVKVLDPPEPPELRIAPQRKLIVLVLSIFGGLVAVAYVHLKSRPFELDPEDPIELMMIDVFRVLKSRSSTSEQQNC